MWARRKPGFLDRPGRLMCLASSSLQAPLAAPLTGRCLVWEGMEEGE